MSTSPIQIRGSVTYRQKWQDIDWAMQAVTVAARLFEIAGANDLCDRLLLIHREAMERRDKA